MDLLFQGTTLDCGDGCFYGLGNCLTKDLFFFLHNMQLVNREHELNIPSLQAHLRGGTRVNRHHLHGMEDKKMLP